MALQQLKKYLELLMKMMIFIAMLKLKNSKKKILRNKKLLEQNEDNIKKPEIINNKTLDKEKQNDSDFNLDNFINEDNKVNEFNLDNFINKEKEKTGNDFTQDLINLINNN